MPTYVALLRAVNVGGRKVPMARLREVLTDDGFADVRTYVQSGNVVFRHRAKATTVADRVHALIAGEFGLDSDVMIRTPAELRDVVKHNPFAKGGADWRRELHVGFLLRKPDADALAAVDPHKAAPDELRVDGREVFFWTPNGWGRSKVSSGLERALRTPMTVRNWRTVNELLAMTG